MPNKGHGINPSLCALQDNAGHHLVQSQSLVSGHKNLKYMVQSAFVDRIERLIFVYGVFFAIIYVRNQSRFCANHEKMVLDFYYRLMALQNPQTYLGPFNILLYYLVAGADLSHRPTGHESK